MRIPGSVNHYLARLSPANFLRVGISLLAVCLAGCTRSGETGMNPGDFPPQFKLPSVEDQSPLGLADFRGKTVLLNFWATWCGPCVEEAPALQRLFERFKDKNFVVLAVAVDDEIEKVSEFRRRFGLSFPVLIDEDGGIKNPYGTTGVPESFFVGPDGKLKLVPDPDSGDPIVRIVGPRAWDSPNSVHRIERMLGSP